MGYYDIRITDTKGVFSIVNPKFAETEYYYTRDYCFGDDDGEESDLVIKTDLRTCEILGIWCTNKLSAIETTYIYDDDEIAFLYDDDGNAYFFNDDDGTEELREKRKASFITPKYALDWDGTGYLRDFTMYYSKEKIKIWIAEGEPAYRYRDDRLIIYYDADYDLTKIYIEGISEDEFASLHEKKLQARRRYFGASSW